MNERRQTSPSILFYYPAIDAALSQLGGSARVTISNALAFKKHFPWIKVFVSGDNFEQAFDLQGVLFIPSSDVIRDQELLDSIKVLVFSTHLGPFQLIKPKADQNWFLDSHCWNLEENSLANLDNFTAVFARSDVHREHLSKRISNKCPVSVVTNGIDPVVAQEAADIERLPLSIMFSGAIVAHKGVHILLEAFLKLLCEWPNASLHLYGGASLWAGSEQYENRLRALNIPKVFFHGVRRFDEMAQFYQRHDVLCSPSDLESFGMSSVEAQAHGCIPVLHDSGGAGATIIEGSTGFLYSPNNPETLLLTLKKALSGSSSMRKNAQEYARTTFSLQRTVRQLSAALEAYLPITGETLPKSSVRFDPIALI